MNPIVKQIVGVILIVIVYLAPFFLWEILSKELPKSVMNKMDSFYNYGILGIAGLSGVGACGWLFYQVFSEIITQFIYKRAHQLLDTAIDKENEYLYITVDCCQSLGEGKSYYIYLHYLFELKTGKKWVYEAKNTQKENWKKAQEYFKKQIGKPIFVKLKGTPENHFDKGNYTVQIFPFKTRFDFGFKIACRKKDGNGSRWRRKI